MVWLKTPATMPQTMEYQLIHCDKVGAVMPAYVTACKYRQLPSNPLVIEPGRTVTR